MKILLFCLLILIIALPAVAEIDLAVTNVGVEDAGGGLGDVVVNLGLRAHGPFAANQTDVTLYLDGVFYDRIEINYGIYEAPGCSYVADYMGLGPSCVDDPGCDLWSINGSMIPGDCILLIPGGVPLSCWCNHPWLVIFHNVNLSQVSVLQVILDAENTCDEYWEDNNTFIIDSPVPDSAVNWGTAKANYR